LNGEENVERKEKMTMRVLVLTNFSECMYGYKDKVVFQEEFDNMSHKVHKQTWLHGIY
jgi:hypothetical protein